MKEHFRGVVWPRPDEQTSSNGEGVFRYIVVGMLVTDKPIEGLDPNETVIDSTMERFVDEMGMAGALERAKKFKPAFATGTADSVLLSLEDIVGEPMRTPSKNTTVSRVKK